MVNAQLMDSSEIVNLLVVNIRLIFTPDMVYNISKSPINSERRFTMAKVIAICNAKGGTCKTPVAINLAACLTSNFNKKVLGLDLDPQGNFAVGMGVDPRKLEKTSFKLLINENPVIEDFIINLKPGFDLIPNSLEPGMET